MNETVKNYFDIELGGYHKAKRRQLHQELIDNLPNDSMTFEDVSILLNEARRKDIAIRQPFFEKVVCPILQTEIAQNNLKAVKYLIKLEQNLLQLREKLYKPSKLQLILKGLEIDSEDKELLAMYEHHLRDYLKYTIHELPSGVLYDMNGADENQCDELIEDLSIYKKICKKLSLDRNELINKCEFHFPNYKAYLQRVNEFTDYPTFLALQTKNLR